MQLSDVEQNRIKEIKKVNREVSMHEDSKEFIRYSVLTTRFTRFDSGKSIYNFTVGNVVTVREGSYFVKEQRHSEIRMWGGVSGRIFYFIEMLEVLSGFCDSACSSNVVVMDSENILSLLEISNGSEVSLRTLIQKVCEPCSLRRSPKSKYVFAKIPSLPSYKLSSLFDKIKNVLRVTITIALGAKGRLLGEGFKVRWLEILA